MNTVLFPNGITKIPVSTTHRSDGGDAVTGVSTQTEVRAGQVRRCGKTTYVVVAYNPETNRGYCVFGDGSHGAFSFDSIAQDPLVSNGTLVSVGRDQTFIVGSERPPFMSAASVVDEVAEFPDWPVNTILRLHSPGVSPLLVRVLGPGHNRRSFTGKVVRAFSTNLYKVDETIDSFSRTAEWEVVE